MPTIIGMIATDATRPPITLEGGRQFPPQPGVSAQRLDNWGDTYTPESPYAGFLLLGGQRADGSWWYQVAGYEGPESPAEDGCWPIGGGSFDEGTSVRLSDGLRLPKAPGFYIHSWVDLSASEAFPGREDDYICVDLEGRATYLFVPGSG